jgi:predicted dehydrogenase
MVDPMPGRALRCGVAGVGSLGQHHARLYAALPQAELVGVYDVNPARAAEIASQHGCQVFADLAALAAACEVISVVVPTDLHAQVALQLLAHGCHLLIEKPLCATLAEAEAVVAAARAAGTIV